MKLPSVLIFTPIYDKKDYCLKEFIEWNKKLTYPNKRHIFIDNSSNLNYVNKLRRMGLEAYHVDRGGSSREGLARAQNLARKLAIEGDYDYMFSLESDIFIPPNAIEKLMIHQLNIVTGLYMLGDKEKGQRVPCITIDSKTKKGTIGSRLLNPEEWMDYLQTGIHSVAAGGMGCCLIYKKVFKQLGFTYLPGHRGHSDVFFFLQARRMGQQVFVDTDVVCDHKNSNWNEVEDR
jgi:GT2 family glycosyltransferase